MAKSLIKMFPFLADTIEGGNLCSESKKCNEAEEGEDNPEGEGEGKKSVVYGSKTLFSKYCITQLIGD